MLSLFRVDDLSYSSSFLRKKINHSIKRFFQTKQDEIAFCSDGILTLGAEIELQILDTQTQNLVSRAGDLLEQCRHLPKVKPEFYLSTIEINTDKCVNVHQVEKDLKETINSLQVVGRELGVHFSSTGSHPFSLYKDCSISPTDRYLELIDRNQWLTRRMTVYGLHVHIGMETAEDCIRYNNFFMYFLPHLLALSGSSPFWQGCDTGLSSCRPTTYESLPTAGQPYHVRNWQEFENMYETLVKCGSIKSLKDLWWDMRPSPAYGTLEIRVCDGPASLYEATAIIAFIHTLAHWFKERGSWIETVSNPPHWIFRENKWRSMRYGLDAQLVMNTTGKTKSLREDLLDWINKLKKEISLLGYEEYFSNLLNIIDLGNSSTRQRKVFEKTNSLESVVIHNANEFKIQKPYWD